MQGFLVVTFRDSFLQETTRRFEISDGTGVTAADRLASIYNRAGAIYAAVQAATGAAIVKAAIDITDAEFTLIDAVDTVTNISDDGVLSVALIDTVAKKGTIRIPAPLSTTLLTNGAPDPTQAAWEDLVGEFAGSAPNGRISDGERVDPDQGTSGILKTWRASRGRRSE